MSCHSFLDTGGRHDTLGSETKHFNWYSNSGSQSISTYEDSLSSSSHMVMMKKGPDDTQTCSEWHYRRIPSLGNLDPLYWIEAHGTLTQRETLYLLYGIANTPAFCFGRRHYILYNHSPYKHPGKDGPEPRQLVLLLTRCAETPKENCLQQVLNQLSKLSKWKRRAYSSQNKWEEGNDKG